MYFDFHAHYDDSKFDPDRSNLLKQLPTQEVRGIINSGSCINSSYESVKIAESYPYVYASVGVHPHEVHKMKDADLSILEELASHKKVVAIGEIGLDYHYDYSPRDVQQKWFTNQLALAKKLNMPVVIHSREASQDTLNIIKDSGIKSGALHCYSGHLPMALEYIRMGFYISLGGVVTYKNAQKTKEVAAGIPLNRLLIETDAPYLSPVPFRGKRNDSSRLSFIAEEIANIRNITKEEVASAALKNAENLLKHKF